MTHHPHVHMIVTGGGISHDGSRWIASRPDYLVCVKEHPQHAPAEQGRKTLRRAAMVSMVLEEAFE
jgi:hypothetical protein